MRVVVNRLADPFEMCVALLNRECMLFSTKPVLQTEFKEDPQ